MYEQLDIFSILPQKEYSKEVSGNKRLDVGDYIGRIVLGEIEKGRITQVEGNDTYFFYRTDKGCFSSGDRTDFDQMAREAEEIRKQYKTIEIDCFEKFFAVEYPPREGDGKVLCAMAGIFQNMLFWKEDITYQFLEPVKNIEKAYEEKIHKITHKWPDSKSEKEYTVLNRPIRTNRLYWSKNGFYADARYVQTNG